MKKVIAQGSKENNSNNTKIHCRISRPSFLPGDVLRGIIVIANKENDCEILAMSVQIHGHIKIDRRWVSLPVDVQELYHQNKSQKGTDYAPDISEAKYAISKETLPDFDEFQQNNMACIFTTPPAAFKSQKVYKDTAAAFSFTSKLPDVMLPSFRGLGGRFFYVISVRVETAKSKKPHILHLPFVVLSSGFLQKDGFQVNFVSTSHVNLDILQKAIYLDNDEFCWDKHAPLDGQGSLFLNMNSDAVSILTGEEDDYMYRTYNKSASTIYAIRNGKENIGLFIVHKKNHCPGDALIGTFDFSKRTIKCFQVSATLVFEEYSSGELNKKKDKGNKKLIQTKIVDAYHEYTANCENCSMMMRIPLDATPSFVSPLLSLEWTLNFEFIISNNGKRDILKWSLPVTLYPPHDIDFSNLFWDQSEFCTKESFI